ncbi:hypothetical protein ACVIIV_003317 [Bradyrhizobium sp. USDA 4354]
MMTAKCAIIQRDATCDSSPLEQLTKTFLNFKYKMHEPQFRHAACLIAASIITDVLMMLGRTRRTFNPAKCVGAPWFGGVPFRLQCSSPPHNARPERSFANAIGGSALDRRRTIRSVFCKCFPEHNRATGKRLGIDESRCGRRIIQCTALLRLKSHVEKSRQQC